VENEIGKKILRKKEGGERLVPLGIPSEFLGKERGTGKDEEE